MIGDYLADLIIEDRLIIELKTAKTLAPEHEAQILGYLKSARLEHGLLINFGSYKFQLRKFVWNHRPSPLEPVRTIVGLLATTFLGFFGRI